MAKKLEVVKNEERGETMSSEQMAAELARLKAENEELKAHATAAAIRVSAKGGVSVYGLGRFPITLYREQWDKLLAMAPAIADFIVANEDKLKVKAVAAA